MSTVSTKSLILSQPKSGAATDVKSVPTLTNEVIHDESCTFIKVEIPGVDPSTVDVDCQSNILKVSCERGEFVHPVDPTIDTAKIKADIQWGLLTLTIPSPPAPAAHSIKISIHDAIKSAKSKFTPEE